MTEPDEGERQISVAELLARNGREVGDCAGGRRRRGTSGGVSVAQVIVALAVGALLFVGFERLWADLPWIALVMAILVILGLVAVSRVLRLSADTLSVMIAVGAGLLVTMGPLALVLSQR